MNSASPTPSTIFKLKVQSFGQLCLFELSSEQGQSLTVQVRYPTDIIQLYQDWQRAYLGFYQSGPLRGRAGNINVSMDWRTKLSEAEVRLKEAFHYWLRSADLYELRSRIASGGRITSLESTIQVFLTCSPLELERLPWETWNLQDEFGLVKAVQILRSPLNVRGAAHARTDSPKGKRVRILAILGDDTGLNFEADRQAVESLQKIAEVHFIGWQPEHTETQVIQQILEELANPQGWDVLFFAGHSQETELTGGELSIAPGVKMTLQSLLPQLTIAKQNGLQVAIFNSCNGLSLANRLIDLGLSQVAIMREPIHNAVAQQFLRVFLQGLGQHLNVYDAIQLACDFLHTHQGVYPSTSLIPSLFCHPGAAQFQILPSRFFGRFRALLPNWIEAIALGTAFTLSLLMPVQDRLLDARLLAQAYYRNLTGQVPAQTTPPIALIQIDAASIQRSGISQHYPIDRRYLAQLIDRLHQLQAPIIGIDILLDTRQSGDTKLADAVHQAVNGKVWLIFSAILNEDTELGVSQTTGIASRNWTLQGYTDAHPSFVELPMQESCEQSCPFSYLLALVYTAKQQMSQLPQLNLARTADLRIEFLQKFKEASLHNPALTALKPIQSPLGSQPLVDFSVPPGLVYTRIPAWKLLDSSQFQALGTLPDQLVLIAGGCDDRLGFSPRQSDCLPTPSATAFWTQQDGLTGGEALAYMAHHYLTQRLVIPIPDWWMVGLAALVGKGVVLFGDRHRLSRQPFHRVRSLIGTVGAVSIYGLITLQLYLSGAILLPWLLPSSLFLTYVVSDLRKKHYD